MIRCSKHCLVSSISTPSTLPNLSFKGMDSLKKKAPFITSVALFITSTSLGQADPKVPLGQDSNLEVPFPGSSSHEQAYKMSENCQSTYPSKALHESRLIRARGSWKWFIRVLGPCLTPLPTCSHTRRQHPLAAQKSVGPPLRQHRLHTHTWPTSFPLHWAQEQNETR